MAIAETGPLALKLTIRAEELVKAPSLPETDVSTREISDSAGFVEPDAFSEFYGYSSAVLPTMASIRLRGGPNDSYFNIGATPATTGFVALTSRGFYMGTDSRGPQYNTRYQVDTSNSLAEFNRSFTGLAAGRTYYIWGYVQNIIGEGYTTRLSVATLPAVSLATYATSYFSISSSVYGFIEESGKAGPLTNSNWSEFAWDNYWDGYLDLSSNMGVQYLHPYYGWTNGGNTAINVSYHRYSYDQYVHTYGDPTRYGPGRVSNLQRANNAATRQRRYGDYRLDFTIYQSCCQNINWGGTFYTDDNNYVSANNPREKDGSRPDYCYGCTHNYYGQYNSIPDAYYGSSDVRYLYTKLNSQYSQMRLRTVYNSYWYSN